MARILGRQEDQVPPFSCSCLSWPKPFLEPKEPCRGSLEPMDVLWGWWGMEGLLPGLGWQCWALGRDQNALGIRMGLTYRGLGLLGGKMKIILTPLYVRECAWVCVCVSHKGARGEEQLCWVSPVLWAGAWGRLWTRSFPPVPACFALWGHRSDPCAPRSHSNQTRTPVT